MPLAPVLPPLPILSALYSEFLRRIMAAGVASYGVFLGGRRALYVSRRGEVHVERFPGEP